MDFTFRPSLQSITLVKIAVELWKSDPFIEDVGFYLRRYVCVEQEVEKKALKLPLPESLRNKLPSFVWGLVQSLYFWEQNLRCILGNDYIRDNSYNILWTPEGTVDKKKTAEIFVKDENLSVLKRYELACICCMEDCIRHLWDLLDHFDKRYVKTNHGLPLVTFWSLFMEGRITSVMGLSINGNNNVTPYESGFLYSAEHCNDAATAYFFQKLTPEEKERNLVKAAEHLLNESTFNNLDYCIEVLYFLLSNMNKGQQEEVFMAEPQKFLIAFLRRPWEDLFMEIAERMSTFLSATDCFCILPFISRKSIHDYTYYQHFFRMFWRKMLATHETFFSNESVDAVTSGTSVLSSLWDKLLSDLLLSGNKEKFKLILKYANTLQRESIVYSCVQRFEHLDYCFNVDALKILFQTCVASKSKMIHFKKILEERLKGLRVLKEGLYTPSQLTRRRGAKQWRVIFRLMDDLIEEYEETEGIEEGNFNPAKRLRIAGLEE